MIELIDELRKIQEELQSATKFANDLAYRLTLNSLLENAKEVGKAWCGSWYGYQACVYYKNFDSPPAGTYFDHRWGFEVDLFGESRKKSSWSEYSYDQVMSMIKEGIENKDIDNVIDHTKKWIYGFKNKKVDVLDIIEIAQESNSSYFERLLHRTKQLEVLTVDEIIASERPTEMATEDPIAIQQGFWTPPHIQVIAEAHWSIRAVEAVHELGNLIEDFIAQMERVRTTTIAPQITGRKVFIGHGRDKSWLQLRNFLKEKLCLPITAYEEESAAGTDIFGHVVSLIDGACIAFLVMTAEDKIKDDKGNEEMHPRLNVVHELGICQAKLGPNRAISLVEKGCTVPTNIIGTHHIYFEKDNIMSASEDIRDVLKREKII